MGGEDFSRFLGLLTTILATKVRAISASACHQQTMFSTDVDPHETESQSAGSSTDVDPHRAEGWAVTG